MVASFVQNMARLMDQILHHIDQLGLWLRCRRAELPVFAIFEFVCALGRSVNATGCHEEKKNIYMKLFLDI